MRMKPAKVIVLGTFLVLAVAGWLLRSQIWVQYCGWKLRHTWDDHRWVRELEACPEPLYGMGLESFRTFTNGRGVKCSDASPRYVMAAVNTTSDDSAWQHQAIFVNDGLILLSPRSDSRDLSGVEPELLWQLEKKSRSWLLGVPGSGRVRSFQRSRFLGLQRSFTENSRGDGASPHPLSRMLPGRPVPPGGGLCAVRLHPPRPPPHTRGLVRLVGGPQEGCRPLRPPVD